MAAWTAIGNSVRKGFTEHEHLDNLGIIHMNGRVYDPIIGRFLSADPFIPNPMSTQSFNRYSYVENAPLTFTDPSGFFREHDRMMPAWIDWGGGLNHWGRGGSSPLDPMDWRSWDFRPWSNPPLAEPDPAEPTDPEAPADPIDEQVDSSTTSCDSSILQCDSGEAERVLVTQAVPVSSPLLIGSRGTGGVESVIRVGTEAAPAATPKPSQNLGQAVRQTLRQAQEQAAQNPKPGSPESLAPRKGESLQQFKDRLNDQHRGEVGKYKPSTQAPPKPPADFQSKWKDLIDALGDWLGGTEIVVISSCAENAERCEARIKDDRPRSQALTTARSEEFARLPSRPRAASEAPI